MDELLNNIRNTETDTVLIVYDEQSSDSVFLIYDKIYDILKEKEIKKESGLDLKGELKKYESSNPNGDDIIIQTIWDNKLFIIKRLVKNTPIDINTTMVFMSDLIISVFKNKLSITKNKYGDKSEKIDLMPYTRREKILKLKNKL